MLPIVRLKPGKEKLPRHRHPWIFSGAIASVDGKRRPGDLVAVHSAKDEFLATGYFSPSSQIRVRLLEWDATVPVDAAWWRTRLMEAIDHRQSLLSRADTDACRFVYSEADGLPGLIVDKYGDYLVVQVLATGIEHIKAQIFADLQDLLQPTGIYERSDADVRKLENLKPVSKVVAGDVPQYTEIREHGLRFRVDLHHGHKTGFYLDQRDNRQRVAAYAAGRDVLDCFCYSGGFSVACLAAGAASVIGVDSSADALALAEQNLTLNNLTKERWQAQNANVFDQLRHYRDNSQHFDMMILDPPKLAPHRGDVKKAQRAYKDLNLQALKILKPGGILATFSCSGQIGAVDFRQLVAWAASDCNRDVQVLDILSQASDHPIRLSFPESEYLTGLLCRVR